jgi:hypothetical protein
MVNHEHDSDENHGPDQSGFDKKNFSRIEIDKNPRLITSFLFPVSGFLRRKIRPLCLNGHSGRPVAGKIAGTARNPFPDPVGCPNTAKYDLCLYDVITGISG